MTESINATDVSAESLTLMGDAVLVRTMPAEEIQASGLVVPNAAKKNMMQMQFYGEVVKTGPGSLVDPGPAKVWILAWRDESAEPMEQFRVFASEEAARVGEKEKWAFAPTLYERPFHVEGRPVETVPAPAKPGDMVMCQRGTGPELNLADGAHMLVQRTHMFGHGVLASWEPGHRHCWHEAPLPIEHATLVNMLEDVQVPLKYASAFQLLVKEELCRRTGNAAVSCACGESREVDTSLPHCLECPPGPRVVEAKIGVPLTKFEHAPAISAAEDDMARTGEHHGDGFTIRPLPVQEEVTIPPAVALFMEEVGRKPRDAQEVEAFLRWKQKNEDRGQTIYG
jgi:co-chaperonin GroES (HSP10)